MKIRPEHYEHIRAAIAALDPNRVAAHLEQLRSDTRVRNLGVRYRWDLLHAAVSSRWICAELYPYANDEHIDTALRRIVPLPT